MTFSTNWQAWNYRGDPAFNLLHHNHISRRVIKNLLSPMCLTQQNSPLLPTLEIDQPPDNLRVWGETQLNQRNGGTSCLSHRHSRCILEALVLLDWFLFVGRIQNPVRTYITEKGGCRLVTLGLTSPLFRYSHLLTFTFPSPCYVAQLFRYVLGPLGAAWKSS